MLTLHVNKRVHPGRLSDALVAAGLRVVTIRGRGNEAEVLLEDGEDSTAALAVVAAHDPNAHPDVLDLSVLEDDKAPAARRLDVACRVLARMLRASRA